MCNPKPFPRCSRHAVHTLQKAMALCEQEETPENIQSLDQAKRQFLLTPAGIKMLRKQNLNELAEKCNQKREQLKADAVRFLKYSTSVDSKEERWLGDRNLRPDLTNPTVAKAYALAVSAHEGTNRRSGQAFINHPLRVSKHLWQLGYNHEVIAVALLHDAVEDSDMTLADLRKHGFNERIVSGVDSVTKRDGESYPHAVLRASQHPIGSVVKLADNLDNSSEEQLKPFTEEKKAKQVRKYTPARRVLILAIHASRTKNYLNPAYGHMFRTYSLKGTSEMAY